LNDFDDDMSGNFWQATKTSEGARRNARQAG
jgi:hypothetical protein